MDQGIEVLIPPSCYRNPNKFFEEKSSNKTTKWTSSENKLFENALAFFDTNTPDRWIKVAGMIPGKTVDDVKKQYRDLEDDISDIEAGLIPLPGYSTCSLTLEWTNKKNGLHWDKQIYGNGGKRGSIGWGFDQDRKKGVPWTEEEHRQFLMGLRKYGKGNWRNISCNYVTSRTPTQVASHAQKYFIRQLNGGRDKRRSSIHDITTVNMTECNRSSSIITKNNHPLYDSKSQQHQYLTLDGIAKSLEEEHFQDQDSMMVFNSTFQGKDWNTGNFRGSQFGSYNPLFQMHQR